MITYIIWDEDIDDYDDWNGDCYYYGEDYDDDYDDGSSDDNADWCKLSECENVIIHK